MKKLNLFLLLLVLFMTNVSCTKNSGKVNYYKTQNEKLSLMTSDENKIVFLGNSITENWQKMDSSFFSNKNYINRGISGQTSAQISQRFQTDVIDLKPVLVVILAGTNDIAENNGPVTIEEISENIIAMAEQAKSNKIKVILSSVLPVFDYPWRPGLQPVKKIAQLNEILKNYAGKNHLVFLDYYQAMVDNEKGLKDAYTYDGVHPNKAGYQIMGPLAEEAIAKALNQKETSQKL